jgi:hypothetical protein
LSTLSNIFRRRKHLIDLGYSRRRAARLEATSVDTPELERPNLHGLPTRDCGRSAA